MLGCTWTLSEILVKGGRVLDHVSNIASYLAQSLDTFGNQKLLVKRNTLSSTSQNSQKSGFPLSGKHLLSRGRWDCSDEVFGGDS